MYLLLDLDLFIKYIHNIYIYVHFSLTEKFIGEEDLCLTFAIYFSESSIFLLYDYFIEFLDFSDFYICLLALLSISDYYSSPPPISLFFFFFMVPNPFVSDLSV